MRGRACGRSSRKKARALEEAKDFVGCATAYLAIYSSDPSLEQADEVLYNAGVCFEHAHSVGSAISAFERAPRWETFLSLFRSGFRPLPDFAAVGRVHWRVGLAAERFGKLGLIDERAVDAELGWRVWVGD